ncbi:hypothetical protein C8Q80DRAFT_361622 [Daedaleopsis nitida]|nr:hypothetical protein C8Q80DRAFT_361622 [Daedaleopsis nitida]
MSESLVGTYVVLQIDAKAMVAGYADAPISAVARALGTGRYVALVEREVQVPTRSDALGWRMYQVSFVGRHSYSECEASYSLRTNNCIPIFPATLNSETDAAVRASQPLPLPECCHRPSVEAFVRIYPQPYQDPPVFTLSRDQVQRLVKSRKLSASHPSTPNPASAYLSSLRPELLTPPPRARYEAELLPRNHARDLSGTASPTLSALADLALTPSPASQDFSFQTNTSNTRSSSPAWALLPPRITTPVSDITARSETSVSVSALFERARRRHETLDSASVYSTTSTARSSLGAGGPADVKEKLELEDASTSKLALGPEVDLDEVPLVDATLDLGELEDVPDPKGFSEEREVVVQLVQKAKERRRNDPSRACSRRSPRRLPRRTRRCPRRRTARWSGGG